MPYVQITQPPHCTSNSHSHTRQTAQSSTNIRAETMLASVLAAAAQPLSQPLLRKQPPTHTKRPSLDNTPGCACRLTTPCAASSLRALPQQAPPPPPGTLTPSWPSAHPAPHPPWHTPPPGACRTSACRSRLRVFVHQQHHVRLRWCRKRALAWALRASAAAAAEQAVALGARHAS